jgi:hypothetical protein
MCATHRQPAQCKSPRCRLCTLRLLPRPLPLRPRRVAQVAFAKQQTESFHPCHMLRRSFGRRCLWRNSGSRPHRERILVVCLALLGRRHQSSNRAIDLPALRQIDASHPPCPSHQPIRIHRFVFEGTAPVPYCSMRSRSSTCCVEIAPPPPQSSPSSPNAPSLSPHADRAPHQPQFPREIARFRLRPVDTIPTRRDGSRRLSVGAFAPTNCPHPPPRGGSADAAGCVA